METLVATVLIVIIFMISSMVMNSLFANSVRLSNTTISERLHELEYQYQNGAIAVPYYEELDAWEISVLSETQENSNIILYGATNSVTNISIERSKIDDN